MKIWLKDFDHLCLGIYHRAVSQCFSTTSILDVLVYRLKMDWALWKFPADSTWEIFLINAENLFVHLCLIQEQVTNWSTNFDPLLKIFVSQGDFPQHMHTKFIYLLIINLEYFLWPCAKKSLFDPLKQSRKTLWSTLKQCDFWSGSKWYFCTPAMEKIYNWLSARYGSESDYQNVFFIQMLNKISKVDQNFDPTDRGKT